DAWIQKHKAKPFDKDGHWASLGQVINPLLMEVLRDPYIRMPSPKSIGKEYFSLEWLAGYLSNEYRPEDVQATLLQLTAKCIANSILSHKHKVTHLYLCGGGTHNKCLHERIKALLPKIEVAST